MFFKLDMANQQVSLVAVVTTITRPQCFPDAIITTHRTVNIDTIWKARFLRI